MDRIRSVTRSIGTVIGMFTPWKRFPSKVSIYLAAGAGNANAPGRGRFCMTSAGRPGGVYFGRTPKCDLKYSIIRVWPDLIPTPLQQLQDFRRPPSAKHRQDHTAMSRLIESYGTVGFTFPRGVFVFMSSTTPNCSRIARSAETFFTSLMTTFANA